MPKSPTLYALVFVLACLPATAQTRDVSPALVRLEAACSDGKGSGTGFIVALQDATAFIATAQHVVEGCEVEAAFAADPTTQREAVVYRMDKTADLALLRVENPPSSGLTAHQAPWILFEESSPRHGPNPFLPWLS